MCIRLIVQNNYIFLYIYFFFQELLNTSIKAVLYMIAFIVQLSAWTAYGTSSSNIAAGVRPIIKILLIIEKNNFYLKCF